MATEMVQTSCGMCYIGCGIQVKVENGVAVSIEGDPNNPQNRGNICAKGQAGLMNLYNPHRIKTPLKRTNPQRGLHVDPGWKEISWDEALNTIVSKLVAIRDNPKQLYIQGWEVTGDSHLWLHAFASAFGTPHYSSNGSPTCGKVIHPVEFFAAGGGE